MATGMVSRDDVTRLRIARALRMRRKASGKTVAQAARDAGCTRWSWLRWEGGSSVPAEKILSACAAVGLTLDDVFAPRAIAKVLPSKAA